MSRRNSFIIIMSISFYLFLSYSFVISFADGLEIGTNAPFFKVKSGDDKVLTLEMVKGKVVVIFYETKDVVEKNRKLKEELKKFYFEQSESRRELIVRLPIINCSGAFWPFTGIWKSKLKENSEKERIIIYGDWDGKMFSNYKMKDKESNVIILDKKGVIRYFVSGEIKGEEVDKVKRILHELMYEK